MKKAVLYLTMMFAFAISGAAQQGSSNPCTADWFEREVNDNCWDGTAADAYAGGNGTAEDPYQIATPQQLALLAQQTNDGTGGDAYYLLTEDICLNADMEMWTFNWKPIGRVTDSTVAYFRGHFDGNGKTISGLVCETNEIMTDPVIGLFGCTNGAEISNVKLSNCRLTGGDKVGGLVGCAGLTNIYNCSISDGLVSTDNGMAGGLVGRAGHTYGGLATSGQTYSITSCQVLEAVKVEASIAGGVVGGVSDLYKRVPYVIDNCVMQGVTDGYDVQGSSLAGGIVGQMWYGTIVRCTNNQKVIGGFAGGIAGLVNYSSVVECHNNETGRVSSPEGVQNGCVGGILGGIRCSVGIYSSDIRDCHNSAYVSGTRHCGGIVGFYFMNHAETPSFIQNCTNHSRVTCHRLENAIGRESVGGIVGHIGQAWGNLCVVECSNFGDVVMESEEQGDAGGILGSKEEGNVYIVNVFNRGSVSAPIYAGGILGGGENIGSCTIQNVYNAGEVITGQETKGAIAYNQQETDHFSDCYWLYRENHSSVSEGEPLQNACAFHPTESPTEWILDSVQYGTTDLLDALNYGAEALVEQYPIVLNMVHRWQPDTDFTNDGFPVFGGIEVGYPFVGTEWYYEIENENGSITYQHLEYAADTTVNHKDVVIIIRTNTLYDKSEHQEVTREYVYEENGIIYWWNKDLEEFTALYDFSAEAGDEWEIKVGMESITMHVDSVKYYEYDGELYKMLMVSDEDDIFSGNIVCGIGHQTSFFPERLMLRNKGFRVEGIRCFWRNGELMFKYGERDCDEVYEEYHDGIEEDGPSTGSETFTIYPNPTHGVLVVETQCLASHPTQTYCISNLMGQTLMTGVITAETQQIDVTNLPQGMYFITVGDMTQKFVVR